MLRMTLKQTQIILGTK